jgi:hypothetical protein
MRWKTLITVLNLLAFCFTCFTSSSTTPGGLVSLLHRWWADALENAEFARPGPRKARGLATPLGTPEVAPEGVFEGVFEGEELSSREFARPRNARERRGSGRRGGGGVSRLGGGGAVKVGEEAALSSESVDGGNLSVEDLINVVCACTLVC